MSWVEGAYLCREGNAQERGWVGIPVQGVNVQES